MLSLPPTPEKKDSTSGSTASNAGTPTGSDGGNADPTPPLGSVGGALVEGKSSPSRFHGRKQRTY